MATPDFDNPVYAASWPQRPFADGKDYFIFQLLNDAGVAVDPIFHRLIAPDAEDIMLTVVKAHMGRRKLKVFLDPATVAPPHMVKSVKLGDHIP